MLTALRRLARDTRGNVLMIFAFAVLPISFATGMGIDYAAAMRLQTRLNAVLDAAALAGVSDTMMKQPIGDACAVARATFVSQVANLTGLVIDPAADLVVTIKDDFATGVSQTVTCATTTARGSVVPTSRSVTATYAARSRNSFSAMLGRATLDIGGASTAVAKRAPFTDIHMALDTSQSMGLAATAWGAARLYQVTGVLNGQSEACAFGCHVYNGGEGGSYNSQAAMRWSNDRIAAYYGVKLRIDYLRDAAADMVQTAMDNQKTDQLYRFALYRIGATTSDIEGLTTDLPRVKATVGGLTLGPNQWPWAYGDTNHADALSTVLPRIVAHGDGSTQAKARAFFFMITDGLSDGCGTSFCLATVDPAACQRYKDANVTVGIVYTTYRPIMEDPTSWWNTNLNGNYRTRVVDPGYDKNIRSGLERCASPGWFFEADDGDAIHAAMQKLFSQVGRTALLTR